MQHANALRFLSIDMVEQAKSGHPGLPMGMADVVTVLFRDFLHFCPKDPTWPNRDRFVLSAGHGSALLYSALHLLGFEKMTLSELKRFRQLGSLTPGHPEYDLHAGIETTTGPLGQGLATAVGIALGQTLQPQWDYRTYVLASDGDLMEGISYEAASLAGHWKLNKLIVLWDDNRITIDGSTDLSRSEDICARFKAMGWHVLSADGHDEASIHQALSATQTADQPVLIACRTQIGFGAPTKAGTSGCHGSPLGADETKATRQALAWPHEAFVVPDDVAKDWSQFWLKSKAKYEAGNPTPAVNTNNLQKWEDALENLSIPQNLPTRLTSQHCLGALLPIEPLLTGGSADLTPSNNTQIKGVEPYIHYGVREHAMAACMNGLALSGFIPYGGTFLTFSDYLRPALRLSALMKLRVIYIFTHDSIGLGEDGPTHQPIEHLSALQCIPNVSVWRPCNGQETKAAWLHALSRTDGPTCLILSRQNIDVPVPSQENDKQHAHGGFTLLRQTHQADVCLISNGSEVELCLKTADALAQKGIKASVVSIPSLDVFMQQTEAARNSILAGKNRVVVEASEGQRWGCVKPNLFIGLSDFGASAPGEDVYKHFGLTAEKIVKQVEFLN